MESRMNEEKTDALLKWVNTANLSSQVNSLHELSNAQLLMDIVCLTDKDFEVEGLSSHDDNAKWLAKVIKYLENFYHQPLGDFVDQPKITYSQDTLEIGKVLSLLLCCAVQGENVSECIEKITSLEENLQFQLKTIIEAVLKDLDNGKIDSVNVTEVLCQSGSFRDVQSASEEYQSSPIIMSPVSLYNSPIKALMASPQMQSRQSQMTISKLYKRLNQFQIKINSLQRIVSDLEQELEDKRNQIEQRELKIKSLSKEVTKVPALEEEVESLTRFETELNDVNLKCNRLRKATEELKTYKEQFLKLEKDYSDLVAEKRREKLNFDECLKEMKGKNKEQLECVQSLLDNANQTCDQLRIQIQEASTSKEMMMKQSREQRDLYEKQIEKLQKALAESKTSTDKLCLKNDQDVLRHIAREAELKQCFRDKEAALQASIDQIQLQNCELKRTMEQQKINLNEEEEAKTALESSAALSQAKLTEAVCKYERLPSDFISLENESKNTINKILEEKDLINEALKKVQEDREFEINELKSSKDELEERSRWLGNELEEVKQKHLELLTYHEDLQSTMADFLKEKNSLMAENILLKKRLAEEDHLAFELKQFKDMYETFRTENAALLKDNSSLNDKVEQLQHLSKNVEVLQSSLNLANEEKMSAIKDMAFKEQRVIELECLSTKLQENVNGVNEQLQSLREEHSVARKKARQVDSLYDEMTDLRDSLRISNEEKLSLLEKNSSLNDEIVKLGIHKDEHKVLQSHFEALNEEKSLLIKENAELKDKMNQTIFFVHESANLRMSLDEANEEKVSLKEQISSLKCEIVELETRKEQFKEVQNHLEDLKEEKTLLLKENADLKEKINHAESLSNERADQYQSMDFANKEYISLKERNSTLKDEIAKLEKISKEHEKLQIHFEASTKEKLMILRENGDLREKISHTESLSSECVRLRQSLDLAIKENVSLEERNSSLKDNLMTLSDKHKLLQSHFEASTETKLLSVKENVNMKEKTHTESLSKECEVLRQSLEATKEKASLAEDNALLKSDLRHAMKSYNYAQCEKETSFTNEKLSPNQDLPPVKSPDGETKYLLVDDHNIDPNLHERLISNLEEIMRKFKVACSARSNEKSAARKDDIVKIEADLRQCYATIVDQYVEYKSKINDHEDSLEVESNMKEEEIARLNEYSEVSSKDETSIQILELQKKMVLLEKENENLKEWQVKCKDEFLSERTKVEELTKKLKDSEDTIKEINNNNVDLELEKLLLQDQVKKLREEKITLKDYVPQVEEKVVDLEEKLIEEEVISKRLAVEVRSLTAQLAYADRQLRQNSESADSKKERRGNSKLPKTEISGNVRKLSPVSEDSAVTKDSAVTDESIVSMVAENKELSGDETQEEVKMTNMLSEQEEVLKKLRRRSAVYSKTNSKRSETIDKRRSTIGTESFVVGQFSNTIAYEPEEHSYDWDRIMELKKRNSTCLPHMRSSYPVEIQVRMKDEVEEDDLKAGYSATTTNRCRKRLRDNVSDSSIFNTSDVKGHCLARSKSEDAFGKFLSEKMTDNLKSNEDGNMCSSVSFVEQTVENVESNDQCNRRESIAFKVDITPAKKLRMSLRPRVSRPAEKKENGRSKNKVKPQSLKKSTLQIKPNSTKDTKRPLRTKCSNYAV